MTSRKVLAFDLYGTLVDPDRAIGRLVPDDVVGLVRYLREHSAPATA